MRVHYTGVECHGVATLHRGLHRAWQLLHVSHLNCTVHTLILRQLRTVTLVPELPKASSPVCSSVHRILRPHAPLVVLITARYEEVVLRVPGSRNVPVVAIVTAGGRRVNVPEAISHGLVHGRARGSATEVVILVVVNVNRMMSRPRELTILRALHGLVKLRAGYVALRRQHIVASTIGCCLRIDHC